MKVLLISNRCPFPPVDGYMIAVTNMLKGLIENGVEVTLLSMNTSRHFTRVKDLPAAYTSLCRQYYSEVDNSIKIHKAFFNLFTNDSYNISRFYSSDFEKKLIQLLSEDHYDIVQLEGLNLCLYIDAVKKNSGAKVILRAHNVEYRIWERLASGEKNLLKKTYLNLLAGRLKGYESAQMERLDGLVPITQTDGDIFKRIHPKVSIHVSPAGFDTAAYNTVYPDDNEVSLFHIGALNWKPNEQGLKWFFDNVWTDLLIRYPSLKFFVAGKYPPPWLVDHRYSHVEYCGYVEDALAFIRRHTVMIVPLLAGSGMRIKIIEAMACGKTVISTSTGCEGINATGGTDLLIADTRNAFIHAITAIMNDPALRNHIGENARKFIETNFNIGVITRNLVGFYHALAGHPVTAGNQ